jgi:hypothetical protein
MHRPAMRIRSTFLTIGVVTATLIAAAVPASAAMRSGCSLYPESIYRSGGSTYYAATATCGTQPYLARVQAKLDRTGGVQVHLATAQTSAGAASLRSASSSTSCSASYAYRSYGWANDTTTGATEGGSAYKSVTC